MIKAKVIADSTNSQGDRITTMVVTFPRFILAETNTHRMLSRNSASSRAIPYAKMLKSVLQNPFIPIAWQADHKGMQGSAYLGRFKSFLAKQGWLTARNFAVAFSWILSKINVTKQLCNRLLEPFMYHTVIITATDWGNFFHLRCPKYEILSNTYRSKKDAIKDNENNYYKLNNVLDKEWLNYNKGQAEIHMMALAEAMWDVYNESTPNKLEEGEWHIPYGDKINGHYVDNTLGYKDLNEKEFIEKITPLKIKIATARCARVSYTVVGEENKVDNYENDIKLHDRLASSGHWSPFEHCAQAINSRNYSGNFKGFTQYRKMFNNENIK
jgi:hypothetical protein